MKATKTDKIENSDPAKWGDRFIGQRRSVDAWRPYSIADYRFALGGDTETGTRRFAISSHNKFQVSPTTTGIRGIYLVNTTMKLLQKYLN